MFTLQFFIQGLGCASYLVGDDTAHAAAVIDPDRDVRKYIEAAGAHGFKLTHIIETHLHADHVSGNTESGGADRRTDLCARGRGRAPFPTMDLRQGETLTLGDTRFEILETPGHTLESITLLISDTTRGAEPALALTGDTLFVGDVGRPDLVGADAARKLAGDHVRFPAKQTLASRGWSPHLSRTRRGFPVRAGDGRDARLDARLRAAHEPGVSAAHAGRVR